MATVCPLLGADRDNAHIPGMTERHYSESEVAQIFQRASETQEGARAPLASRDGMTLGALQEIGREVGLAPEAIASAARALDRTGAAETRRFLGLPLGVSRVVQLDRRLTESEWERLVVDLRQTFDARGKLGQEGAFRHWANGNLQAWLEPTGDSHRLRLRTRHGGAQAYMLAGLGVLTVGVALAIGTLVGAEIQGSLWTKVASLVTIGGVLFATGALRLPGWARLRRKQMQEIAERVTTQD